MLLVALDDGEVMDLGDVLELRLNFKGLEARQYAHHFLYYLLIHLEGLSPQQLLQPTNLSSHF